MVSEETMFQALLFSIQNTFNLYYYVIIIVIVIIMLQLCADQSDRRLQRGPQADGGPYEPQNPAHALIRFCV